MAGRRESRPGLAPRPSAPQPPAGSRDDAAELLVTATELLHANGADSERTEARTAQIAHALGLDARAALGWSTSAVLVARDRTTASAPEVWPFSSPPAAVGLNRVMQVDAVADRLTRGPVDLDAARAALHEAAGAPATGIALFAAACAVGACGLAVILGAHHPGTFAIIAVSAVVGALLRRLLGRVGANNYWQVAAAGLVAGLGGALSAGLGLSTPLGLAAVCPCMILVPGPHLLKGALDLASLRIGLGVARLVFASITLVSIAGGLLVGLGLGRADLVADPPGRLVPLWVDVPAAGVVAICYGIFYSAPLRVLVWPFVVGMAAHALRWTSLNVWQTPSWVGAGLACFLVGAVLYPVAARRSIPFSAIGFASVVSLMPGVNVFRALGGVVGLGSASGDAAMTLLLETVDNLDLAGLTVFAMTVGFLVPYGVWRMIAERAHLEQGRTHR